MKEFDMVTMLVVLSSIIWAATAIKFYLRLRALRKKIDAMDKRLIEMVS